MKITINKNMTAKEVKALSDAQGFTLHATTKGGFDIVMNDANQA